MINLSPSLRKCLTRDCEVIVAESFRILGSKKGGCLPLGIYENQHIVSEENGILFVGFWELWDKIQNPKVIHVYAEDTDREEYLPQCEGHESAVSLRIVPVRVIEHY